MALSNSNFSFEDSYVFVIQLIDLLQCNLVAHGLVDSYQEGESRRQLNLLAQLLVTPVEAV